MPFGLLFDPLSGVMLLLVTGVGALIHIYSIGYMHGDSRVPRYFAYLNLFIAMMTILVMGDNYAAAVFGLGRRRPVLVPADRPSGSSGAASARRR